MKYEDHLIHVIALLQGGVLSAQQAAETGKEVVAGQQELELQNLLDSLKESDGLSKHLHSLLKKRRIDLDLAKNVLTTLKAREEKSEFTDSLITPPSDALLPTST